MSRSIAHQLLQRKSADFTEPGMDEPHLFASHNPVNAGIVNRFALLSGGGWDAFSKTPTAAYHLICFRVKLHLEPEPTRHCRADCHTANDLSSCRDSCRAWLRWGNGNRKSDGNRRTVLPRPRSGSIGTLVPATPGDLAHTIELQGITVGSKTQDPPFSLHSPRRATILGTPTKSAQQPHAQLQVIEHRRVESRGEPRLCLRIPQGSTSKCSKP
jgi:hypothetical protein